MGLKLTQPKFKMSKKGGFAAVNWTRVLELYLWALWEIRESRIANQRTTDGRPLLDGSPPAGGTGQYSEGYATAKGERGVQGRAIKHSPVGRGNLYDGTHGLILSGDMLRAQGFADIPQGVADKTRDTVTHGTVGQVMSVLKAIGTLAFSALEAKKAYYNDLRRPFVFFTTAEVQEGWLTALRIYRSQTGGTK